MEIVIPHRKLSLVTILLFVVTCVFQYGVDGGRFNVKRCSWIRCKATVQECPSGFYIGATRRCRRNPSKMQIKCCPNSVDSTTISPTTNPSPATPRPETTTSTSTTESTADTDTAPPPTDPSPLFRCRNTTITSYNYAVALVRQQTKKKIIHFCGGTIVNEKFILTAAHCFFHPKTFEQLMTPVLVLAGATDLNQFENSLQIIQVEKVIIHQMYDPRDQSQENDLALVKLTTSLEFNEFVNSATFPPEGFDTTNGPAKVLSWEVVDLYINDQNSRLQYVDVNIIPDQQCSQVHRLYGNPAGKEKLVPETQICITNNEAQSTCPEESGGPLICGYSEIQYVCGVSSITSDNVGVPNVYTDITQYRAWMMDQMTQDMGEGCPGEPVPVGPQECSGEPENNRSLDPTKLPFFRSHYNKGHWPLYYI